MSPVLALRWLRGEALLLADRLDPDPRHCPYLTPGLRPSPAPVAGCADRLRAWAGDTVGLRTTRAGLKDGRAVSVVFEDEDCAYTLSAWPEHPHQARQTAA
ncbi:hypothetical protein [Streptomyces sp. Z26]|uniref:hypothetical protein n=1 Tax=Streptomyces sp. Z26 TaxID=2500177 RepID=UPI000FCAEB62|nr:hypothetical protein [Streptomyces sp. Z26]